MGIDRHRLRPLCCAACGKPLSVAEKLVGVTCTWDSYLRLRQQLDGTEGGFWMSEPNTELLSEDHKVVVVAVDPGELFGLHIHQPAQ